MALKVSLAIDCRFLFFTLAQIILDNPNRQRKHRYKIDKLLELSKVDPQINSITK